MELPDLSAYKGEWVVIIGKKVIGHSPKLKELHDKIHKAKGTPIVTRVPNENGIIFHTW